MLKEELIKILEEDLPGELEFTPVYSQPKLERIRSSHKPIEHLIRWAIICYRRNDREEFGRAYNKILQEYKPILDWAYSCWDYLLTTRGFRYLPRKTFERYYSHGDYKAFTDKDYRKLINRCFKELLLNYSVNGSFTSYIKKNLWDKVVKEYDLLRVPKDKKERLLTDYSYLRCIPYKFFNHYHEKRVRSTFRVLNEEEHKVIELYFFRFYKDEAGAEERNLSLKEFIRIKEQALHKIKAEDPLSYALLKQIERY